jgi:hypothetical protein
VNIRWVEATPIRWPKNLLTLCYTGSVWIICKQKDIVKFVYKTLNDHCCIALRRVFMYGELGSMWKEGSFMKLQVSLPCSLVSVLSQLSPIHTTPLHFTDSHFDVIPHLLIGLLPSGFPSETLYTFVSHVCYMPYPSHSPWLDQYSVKNVSFMKLLITQCYPLCLVWILKPLQFGLFLRSKFLNTLRQTMALPSLVHNDSHSLAAILIFSAIFSHALLIFMAS